MTNDEEKEYINQLLKIYARFGAVGAVLFIVQISHLF